MCFPEPDVLAGWQGILGISPEESGLDVTVGKMRQCGVVREARTVYRLDSTGEPGESEKVGSPEQTPFPTLTVR